MSTTRVGVRATHVFISYSRANHPFVQRLVADLQRSGITVWVDQSGLTPGTPDWETALRDAIGKAHAVILIASEEARKSPYVKDELRLAHDIYHLPVYPLWIAGTQWINCIPLGWGGTQYIDARGGEAQYQAALRQLIAVLSGANPVPSLSPTRTLSHPSPYSNQFPSQPTPRRPKRLRSSSVVVALILLTLILFGVGSIGVYGLATGNWPWSQNASHGKTTDGAQANNATASAQVNNSATASAQANNSATASAQATARANIPGRVWHAQDSGTSHALWRVAWLHSQFVVVGNNGSILTSADGRVWMAQNSGTSQPLNGVVWSGPQFVAVGSSGSILTSADGRAWMAQDSGTSHTLWRVAWSDSQFVAVGDGGTILTSPDGRDWTAQNSGTSQPLYSVAWSGSQFVVVGNSGIILTSP